MAFGAAFLPVEKWGLNSASDRLRMLREQNLEFKTVKAAGESLCTLSWDIRSMPSARGDLEIHLSSQRQ